MALVLGIRCKAYYGAAGSTATNQIENIRTVNQNLSKGKADVTVRSAGNTWRLFLATLKEGEVTFEILHDIADPAYQFIRDAWINDTVIAMAFFDDTTSGLDADFQVFDFSRAEEMEDAVKYNVTVNVTYSTRVPVLT